MDTPNRREFLLTGSAVVVGLSGCLGFDADDDAPDEVAGSDASDTPESLQSDDANSETAAESDGDTDDPDTQENTDQTESQQTESPELPRELHWGRAGAEHMALNCPDDSYWKWVLSPGGSEPIEDATLTVHFEDEPTITDLAGTVRDQGSVHFDAVQRAGTVTDASVSFSGGGDDPTLTLSHSGCVPEPSYVPELVYWQVDFGPGSAPPDPPLYGGNDLDLMAALGNSIDGITENPSAGPREGNGQLDDVHIVDERFSFDDEDEPTAVTVEFEIESGGEPRDLHLATFAMPGPFAMAELELQERRSLVSRTFEGGDHGQLTAPIPQPD
ncbi:hypothetical protein [Halovenus marina]|uniref:hypothetical protein n=1 Tax=Halovenus marina TaxID=3396621 RepID=UPI003F568DDA